MRLWSLHPKYLDRQGLTALWREGLLAQAVLRGRTKGYRFHPQLERFRSSPRPVGLIATYLRAVWEEAQCRGYHFDRRKIVGRPVSDRFAVPRGQLHWEWGHLQQKLRLRSPSIYKQWHKVVSPDAHPICRPVPGGLATWERGAATAEGRDSSHMSQLFRFPSGVRRDPAVEAWMGEHPNALGAIARRWFEVLRACGKDVRELLHDGHPTACVDDAAFAYVNAFTAHVNVGFFQGADIADPDGLLEGTGKSMRHVKLRPERGVDTKALTKLIDTAYTNMKQRVTTPSRMR